MAKSSALDLFNNLTIEDVRSQIAEVDTEIEGLEKKRDSLRTIEKAIDIRDNGKPKRQWSAKRKEKAAAKSTVDVTQGDVPVAVVRLGSGRQTSPETLELRSGIYKLLRAKGPMATSEISRAMEVEYGKVQNALTGGNFEQHGKLWNIKPVA